MPQATTGTPRTRGYRKREKTRSQLIEAGLRVLATKGEGLTVSDVVSEADVSNGTFYNYFVDRDALFDALAEQLALNLVDAAASEPTEDPAMRFAVASGRVLQRAAADGTWGRVVLRLLNRTDVHEKLARHMRDDVALGFAQGRFATGPDDVVIDQLTGLLAMTIRRIVAGEAGEDTIRCSLERGLQVLGVSAKESRRIAIAALAG